MTTTGCLATLPLLLTLTTIRKISRAAIVVWRALPVVAAVLVWAPAASAWSWPLQGPLLQPFAYDESHPYAAGQHRGVDIGAQSEGQAVLAPVAGTVSFAGTVPTSGACLTIETPDGFSVTLTHLGSIRVGKGESVAEGDEVATVGPSGTPEHDGPYVHLGVRRSADPNGYLDPLAFLPPLAPAAPASESPAEPAPAPPAAAGSAPVPAAAPGSASQVAAGTPSQAAELPTAAATPASGASAAANPAAGHESASGTASSAASAPRPLERARDARAGWTAAASGARAAARGRAGRQAARGGAQAGASPATAAGPVTAAVAAGAPSGPGRATMAAASGRRPAPPVDARRPADPGPLRRPAPVAAAESAAPGYRLRRSQAKAALAARSPQPAEPALGVVLAAAPGALAAAAALLVAAGRRRTRTGVRDAAGVVSLPPRAGDRLSARRAA